MRWTTRRCWRRSSSRRWPGALERRAWLPVRQVTRRTWPNGQTTHDELRPLKTVAARLPCAYENPGRFVAGRPLVQGMRVVLSAEVSHTYEELIERILHAGMSYAEAVDQQTSLVICDEPKPDQGKGYQAGDWVSRWSATPSSCRCWSTSSVAPTSRSSPTRLSGDQFTLF